MIQGMEWVIVLVVVAILLLWGPDKIPKIARAIGQARREYEKASRDVQEEFRSVISETPAPATSQPSSDIITIAKSLGIETEGKTRDQIADEIAARLKAKK
ncbi:MAG: twin-arginine translocase TatA/TatE family subunit [Thaumarchaeota archaeon]|nr:twin-arginine translocase TatA/TatE family subunit [Candidatus Calditenuaceae archaeon]MDW8041519.1 twin-arginine translocase TatA/TatE family subunit [Nitrososphaerota archaeon]